MTTTARVEAVQTAGQRGAIGFNTDSSKELGGGVFEDFGALVFSRRVMQQMLPEQIYENIVGAIEGTERIRPKYADTIAQAMKEWAMSHGATHYTHWFQPLTGSSAEKHDSFIDWAAPDAIIDRFDGTQLLQGEPDASSFPSGGLRNTYEARGYTGWDPASPAFLWTAGGGVTLFIPSVFYSWTGDVLDAKIPLMRSEDRLRKIVLKLLELTGSPAKHVYSTLGMEQEYFVIDRALRNLRPDLMLAGRTLYGAPSPKGQELQDHYFGSVKDRILHYMRSFEREALKLGIPVKTRHNEVAPAQHEIAPVYEAASRAVDHNIMLMELMRQTAIKHNLVCLLQEKPFAGLNGSGKHTNWSIATDTGLNLLNPADDAPGARLRFLLVLAAILKGVHRHAGLLRASIASSGNDKRLGGHEAPPAIISVYLGEELDGFLNAFELEGTHGRSFDKSTQDLGVLSVPELPRDNTDRNRTSPFAYTGSKFEFRAVGSAANVAMPATVLNAIVAEGLEELLTEVEATVGKEEASLDELAEAAVPVLQKAFVATRSIRYSGDNYSEAWAQAAQERGLPNISNAVEALEELTSATTTAVFGGILTPEELASRKEIELEHYAEQVYIEVRLAIEIFQTQISPAVLNYQRRIADSIQRTREVVGHSSSVQVELLEKITGGLDSALLLCDELARSRQEGADLAIKEKAHHCAGVLVSKMNRLREAVDSLELIVDDKLWPLPKYRELLFMV